MKEIINTRFAAITGLILIAALSRMLPHPPNFSPIAAIALFGGAYFSNKKLAFIVPLLSMFISDLFIGLHDSMITVYISFAIIVAIGFIIKDRISFSSVLLASVASSVVFFVISNFGSFLFSGLYEQSFAGLVLCYEMAIPFFRNTFFSSVIYSAVMFGGFALAERYIPQLAKVKA